MQSRSLVVMLPGAFALMRPGLGAAEFYVARKGKDSNPGTRSAPFADLVRARAALRLLTQRGGLPTEGVSG